MLSFFRVLAANSAAFVGLHLLLNLALMKVVLPHFFNPHRWPFRTQRWERSGRIYQKLFFVHRWKGFIPDCTPFNRRFSKRRLLSLMPSYLNRFQLEICRGEFTHCVGLMFLPVFLIWNPPWARFLMVFVFLFGHVPCILVQRYNRPRFVNLNASQVSGFLLRRHQRFFQTKAGNLMVPARGQCRQLSARRAS